MATTITRSRGTISINKDKEKVRDATLGLKNGPLARVAILEGDWGTQIHVENLLSREKSFDGRAVGRGRHETARMTKGQKGEDSEGV